MKRRKKKIIGIINITICISMIMISMISNLGISVKGAETNYSNDTEFVPDEQNMQKDQTTVHHPLYDFDNINMKMSNVYVGTTVAILLENFEGYHDVEVFKDGNKVEAGLLEAGMIVSVSHKGKYIGSYTIAPLISPSLQSRSNKYGYVKNR